ncbi:MULTISPECIES: L-lactate permease [unclassified Dehalobacter]|uniref:L-lactate permease n=1 Tax=unclassified Dehalobacter TaxID=2635733 RepID=UPI000E6BE1D7|nr:MULTISPECIES: L-lactate permease [unclassified Dehalobacter]RJE47869.1 lactate permease [Dehalobacter sp. MCB1]TCX48978.1 lactate permease [Dehalobacter sp. 14DCB1]TCX56700.1 lactate permease [Dehalobacter sp. 12DCB1]
MLPLLLALLPIVVIVVMLIVFKKPAHTSGIVGWLAVSLVAFLFFQTSGEVIVRSTLAGLIKSFSVSLIVATSLLQMAYMEKTGALRRIIIFIKTLASENRAVQIMMINIGFGTLMVAVGATPVSLLPPILIAMGYSTYVAIALPAIGYDSLCTYALLGAPIVVFVDIANSFLGKGNEITLSQAGSVFFMFLPVVSTLIGFSMLWIVGKWKAVKEGIVPVLVTGITISIVAYFTNHYDNLVVLTGVLSGFAVILVMVLYLKLTGKKIIDRSRLTSEELAYEKEYPLWKAIMPWLLLIVLILALNLPKESFDYLYRTLTLGIPGLSADGKPIATRALWNAYTWILVSILISIPIMRPKAAQIKDSIKVWWRRAPKPVFSAAIFFAIGEVMNMSGFNMASNLNAALPKTLCPSMVKVLADYSAQAFHGAYGAVVSFIGLFGGFITGSEASTIAMFAKYTMSTASNLNWGLTGIIIVTAGLAFGGGLASVISPAKLQNAAASIDKLGEENKVIRVAFVISLILSAVTAAVVVALLKFLV